MTDINTEFFALAEQESGDDGISMDSAFPYVYTLPKSILPKRGRYLGARYRFSLSFQYGRTLTEAKLERDIGETVSIVQFNCEPDHVVNQLGTEVAISDGRYGLSRDSCGLIDALSRPEAVPWYEDTGELPSSDDCTVRMRIQYDPGLSLSNNPDPERIKACDQQWSWKTAFTDLGLTVDYRGRIAGRDTVLRLPMPIRYALPLDEKLIVLVDQGADGADKPTVDIPSGRNLICVDSSGDVCWTVDAFETDADERPEHAWICWNGDTVVSYVFSAEYLYQTVDVETGELGKTELVPAGW